MAILEEPIKEVKILKNYIDGDWIESQGELKEVVNPATGKTIARVSINDLIVFVTAKVLLEQTQLNCFLINERITYYSDINIGVAVSIEGDLIVPVVKNTNLKNLSALSQEIKRLINLAKQKN